MGGRREETGGDVERRKEDDYGRENMWCYIGTKLRCCFFTFVGCIYSQQYVSHGGSSMARNSELLH